jgi:hypothetical protein
MSEVRMLSLYDYLKRAAGSQLGKEVAIKAAEMKVGFEVKHVENPSYTGEIMMYPETFLDWYFKRPDAEKMMEDLTEINTQLTEDSYNNELPF